MEIYQKQHLAVATDIKGFWYTDDQTRSAMAEIQETYAYQAEPHGAIAYAGLMESGLGENHTGIFLETAHPAKFPEEVEKSTAISVQIPDALKEILLLEKKSIKLPNSYLSLQKHLQQMY
jgi:threonine synthase